MIPALTVNTSGQFTNWTVTAPYYGHPNFNPVTGVFTVPSTGRYAISATINYVTTAAVSISLGPGINPYFAVQRLTPSATDLITGLLPVLNISAIVTLRGLLGNGCVTLAGDVSLNAGDTIALFYNSTGATVTLQIGNSGTNGIVWSVHRIA
ncbi:MAG: hypothetical protein A9Z00_14920 [Thermobacillus sp. ZCTH02-B1]|uniref:hypothetical protein n=1 Tax=Thermobacillus sp. ZCTH02-B1 TaxID=1858795 RepID=UPI000B54DFE7|nr:hypothetical protein [Thermobacillus sp. ZCTH02-B1]OUM96303.1 MAG: hypothetical protein A9Z00_14920 [Thermobacillus sp. ZCTH02-B1]